LHLGVPNLGVGEYLPDEVYGLLDLKVVSWFLPFNDQGSAYHMVVGRDIEEEGFSSFGSDEDWGQRQGCFEALQSLMSLLSPDESVHLFEELVEWHPSFTEPRDEPAQSGQIAGEPLHALDVVYGAYVGNGHDFFGVGLDASLRHNVS